MSVLGISSLYYNIDSIFKIYMYAFIFNSVFKLRHWPDILVELYLEKLYCRMEMANNNWDTVIKRCLSRLVAGKKTLMSVNISCLGFENANCLYCHILVINVLAVQQTKWLWFLGFVLV